MNTLSREEKGISLTSFRGQSSGRCHLEVCVLLWLPTDSRKKANPSSFIFYNYVDEEEGAFISLASKILITTPSIHFPTNELMNNKVTKLNAHWL